MLALGNCQGRKGRLSNAVILSVHTPSVIRACREKKSIEGCHAKLDKKASMAAINAVQVQEQRHKFTRNFQKLNNKIVFHRNLE